MQAATRPVGSEGSTPSDSKGRDEGHGHQDADAAQHPDRGTQSPFPRTHGDYDPSQGTVLIGDTAPKDWALRELSTQRSVMLHQHGARFGLNVAETVPRGCLPPAIDREVDIRIAAQTIPVIAPVHDTKKEAE